MKCGLIICLVLLVTNGLAEAGDGKHLFILSGQSNMRRPLPESFEQAVSQVLGADSVIVVTHAHPSQPIRRWYRNWVPPEGQGPDEQENGTLHDALLSKVNEAPGDCARPAKTPKE